MRKRPNPRFCWQARYFEYVGSLRLVFEIRQKLFQFRSIFGFPNFIKLRSNNQSNLLDNRSKIRLICGAAVLFLSLHSSGEEGKRREESQPANQVLPTLSTILLEAREKGERREGKGRGGWLAGSSPFSLFSLPSSPEEWREWGGRVQGGRKKRWLVGWLSSFLPLLSLSLSLYIYIHIYIYT